MSLLAVLYISSKQDFGWTQDRYWQEFVKVPKCAFFWWLCFIFFCFCLLLALIDTLIKKGKKGGGQRREVFMNFILHPVKHRVVTYVVIELSVACFCPSMFTYFIHFLFFLSTCLNQWNDWRNEWSSRPTFCLVAQRLGLVKKGTCAIER